MVLTGTDHQNYCDVNLTAGKILLQKKSVLGTERDPFEVMQHLDNLVVGFFKKSDADCKKSEGVTPVVAVEGDSSAAISEPLLAKQQVEKYTGKLNYTTEDLLMSCTAFGANNRVPVLPQSTIDYMKRYLVSVEDLKDPELSCDSFFDKVTKGIDKA